MMHPVQGCQAGFIFDKLDLRAENWETHPNPELIQTKTGGETCNEAQRLTKKNAKKLSSEECRCSLGGLQPWACYTWHWQKCHAESPREQKPSARLQNCRQTSFRCRLKFSKNGHRSCFEPRPLDDFTICMRNVYCSREQGKKKCVQTRKQSGKLMTKGGQLQSVYPNSLVRPKWWA